MLTENIPEKERYKINIIPCNTANFSKRQMTKARSADDMDMLIKDVPDVVESVSSKKIDLDQGFESPDKDGQKGGQMFDHLAMIANRARNVERKNKKMKSYIDIKIGADSFISEKAGKFSDYYKIMNRIGEGGYGQVFKVQHKITGFIRAMKSNH